MVRLDLTDPRIQEAVRSFGARHFARLLAICHALKQWLADAWMAESAAAESANSSPRRLAVVLDIDEVLLCNIHENRLEGRFYVADHFAGPDGRNTWPRGETRLGPALPGAHILLEHLMMLDVDVFLVTGRRESLRAETVENLNYVGLGPYLGAVCGWLMMCPNEYPGDASIAPFKENCRARIGRTHRIVANIGDQVSDLGLHGDRQVLLDHPFYRTA